VDSFFGKCGQNSCAPHARQNALKASPLSGLTEAASPDRKVRQEAQLSSLIEVASPDQKVVLPFCSEESDADDLEDDSDWSGDDGDESSCDSDEFYKHERTEPKSSPKRRTPVKSSLRGSSPETPAKSSPKRRRIQVNLASMPNFF